MRPRLGKGILITRTDEEPTHITDSWMRALSLKANSVKLGVALRPGGYTLRDSLRYNVLHRMGWPTAQVVVLCDGQREVAEIKREAARILNTDEEAVAELVDKTVSFLETRGLLDSPARRARQALFFFNPRRLFSALWYVAAYHLLGRRSQEVVTRGREKRGSS
ncbi:MAG: hypothetical protein K6T75_08030 [Acetobacteraceae bacterium]|nr:hypothetical protein [Acetobacteraceae bacterium]